MMRFILKCAFWLGLVAFLLPFGTGRGESDVQMSWLGAIVGIQEAVQDLSGFCERAPTACDTGREAAVFAGERIGDGLAIAYAFIDDRRDAGAASEEASKTALVEEATPAGPMLAGTVSAARGEPSTDPVTTGTLSSPPVAPGVPLPRAYLAPKRSAGVETGTAGRVDAAARVIPTPAPRG